MIITQDKSNIKGYIFDIQGLSVHDGPGCRTLIFLNGCTLNCFWCSNPEGISKKPSLLYFSDKCISCGNCVDNCNLEAIRMDNEKLVISRQLCANCESLGCVEGCLTGALRFGGYEISLSKLFDIIQRDRQYWGSEGGITLTGGEPLLQIEFTTAILDCCHQSYIHTAIETCGNVPWSNFSKVIPFLDWIFFDLKQIDSKEHKKATKAGNLQILENARKLSKEFKGRLVFRLPIISGFNDTEENIEETISFLKEIEREEINILPIHHLGSEKYKMLDKEYLGKSISIPTIEHLKYLKNTFKSSGIDCYIGSETPF